MSESASSKSCSVQDCTNPVLARGWCGRHYQKWKREGSPEGEFRQKNEGRRCSVQDCDRDAKRRSFCVMHYHRWRSNGDPGEAGSRRMDPTVDGLCRVDGCDKKSFARQLCPMHLERVKVRGEVGGALPERQRKGSGAVIFKGSGYRAIYDPDHA